MRGKRIGAINQNQNASTVFYKLTATTIYRTKTVRLHVHSADANKCLHKQALHKLGRSMCKGKMQTFG